MVYNQSIAIDTNTFSLLLRGDEKVRGIISTAQLVVMPIVVVAELQAGFLYDKKTAKYGPILDDFLSDPRTKVAHIIDETVQIYAEMYAQVRSNGKQLSNNDLWIAALCVQYNHPLVTFDRDFDALPQVRRVVI